MASGMLQSERRWTSRKSGMTVLGKVPKPINLPSQKLENRGLDPNVEIVPKGTLTWGTRPLLATSSAWGSSTLSSPRADGNANSPIHTNGRPSSGGSGTRPSTGSSERSSEPATISWGPSSRPSSASGPSSLMSAIANRPPSAETRPNSSHLSRFAENSGDSASWAAAGASEKPDAELSKGGFTLSSGDFPLLGSDKVNEAKSQGLSSKFSAPISHLTSGLEGTSESLLNSGNPCPALHENFNSWNADTHPLAGYDVLTRTENWRKDNINAHSFYDLNMPTQQYGPWTGSTHSNIVLCGGPDAGSGYRPSFAPSGAFHVGPYYTCVSAGVLCNTQAFQRKDAVPSGVHFKNDEIYRHIPSESYITHDQSGISLRPGSYLGPNFFDGCYAPPILTGLDITSELDLSYAEISGQYAIQNHHLPEHQRLQPWRFHAKPDGSSSELIKQHMIPDHANETQGKYKVLLKKHKNQEEADTFEKNGLEIRLITHRESQHGFSSPERDLLENNYKQAKSIDKQHESFHSKHPNNLDAHNDRHFVENVKPADHNVIKKLDTVGCYLSSPQTSISKQNANLLEKIEVLNSKSMAVNAQFEGESCSTIDKKKMIQNSSGVLHHFEMRDLGCSRYGRNASISCGNVGTSQLNTYSKVVLLEPAVELNSICHHPEELAIVPSKPDYEADNENLQSHNQKRARNLIGRIDQHHGNLKFGSYCTDELNDSLEKTGLKTEKSGCLLPISCSNASQRGPEDQSIYMTVTSTSALTSLKSVDHDIQHAKLKELARLRALELHKEEKGQTAEQKAKSLVQLAELNRRTSTILKQTLSRSQPPIKDIFCKDETISNMDAKSTIASNIDHGICDHDIQIKNHVTGGNIMKQGDYTDLLYTQSSVTSDSIQPCDLAHEKSQQLSQKITPENSVISKKKQGGYRRRRNVTDETDQAEKLNNTESSGSTGCVSMISEESLNGIGILNSDASSLIQPSNKNIHGSKYRNRMSDTQSHFVLPFSTQFECTFGKSDADCDEMKSQEKFVEPGLVSKRSLRSLNETMTGNSIDLIADADCDLIKLTNDKQSNSFKPQSHKKPVRTMQSDKPYAKYQSSEAVVWAPVKTVSKDELSEHKSSASEVTNILDGKNGHNGAKERRAEMERYVPKPVAKELSLQGCSYQSSPPVTPASSVNKVENKDLAPKARPLWRQRNRGESPLHGKNTLESNEQLNSVVTIFEKLSGPNNELYSESSNFSHEDSIITLGIAKPDDTVKQKWKHCKHRVDGGNIYATQRKELQEEMFDKRAIQCQFPVDFSVRNSTRNEIYNTCSRHIRSHWQPKSMVHSQQCKESGGHSVSDHLLASQFKDKSFDESDSVDKNQINDADAPKWLDGHCEREDMKNIQKKQHGTRERREFKHPSKNQNHSTVIESKQHSSNASSYQQHINGSRCEKQHAHFSSKEDATYWDTQKALSIGDRRNAGQRFEFQTGLTNDGNMLQQNSSASEVTSEAHLVSSGSNYGAQGRSRTKHGGHFYGPRHGALACMSGAYDNRG